MIVVRTITVMPFLKKHYGNYNKVLSKIDLLCLKKTLILQAK